MAANGSRSEHRQDLAEEVHLLNPKAGNEAEEAILLDTLCLQSSRTKRRSRLSYYRKRKIMPTYLLIVTVAITFLQCKLLNPVDARNYASGNGPAISSPLPHTPFLNSNRIVASRSRGAESSSQGAGISGTTDQPEKDILQAIEDSVRIMRENGQKEQLILPYLMEQDNMNTGDLSVLNNYTDETLVDNLLMDFPLDDDESTLDLIFRSSNGLHEMGEGVADDKPGSPMFSSSPSSTSSTHNIPFPTDFDVSTTSSGSSLPTSPTGHPPNLSPQNHENNDLVSAFHSPPHLQQENLQARNVLPASSSHSMFTMVEPNDVLPQNIGRRTSDQAKDEDLRLQLETLNLPFGTFAGNLQVTNNLHALLPPAITDNDRNVPTTSRHGFDPAYHAGMMHYGGGSSDQDVGLEGDESATPNESSSSPEPHIAEGIMSEKAHDYNDKNRNENIKLPPFHEVAKDRLKGSVFMESRSASGAPTYVIGGSDGAHAYGEGYAKLSEPPKPRARRGRKRLDGESSRSLPQGESKKQQRRRKSTKDSESASGSQSESLLSPYSAEDLTSPENQEKFVEYSSHGTPEAVPESPTSDSAQESPLLSFLSPDTGSQQLDAAMTVPILNTEFKVPQSKRGRPRGRGRPPIRHDSRVKRQVPPLQHQQWIQQMQSQLYGFPGNPQRQMAPNHPIPGPYPLAPMYPAYPNLRGQPMAVPPLAPMYAPRPIVPPQMNPAALSQLNMQPGMAQPFPVAGVQGPSFAGAYPPPLQQQQWSPLTSQYSAGSQQLAGGRQEGPAYTATTSQQMQPNNQYPSSFQQPAFQQSIQSPQSLRPATSFSSQPAQRMQNPGYGYNPAASSIQNRAQQPFSQGSPYGWFGGNRNPEATLGSPGSSSPSLPRPSQEEEAANFQIEMEKYRRMKIQQQAFARAQALARAQVPNPGQGSPQSQVPLGQFQQPGNVAGAYSQMNNPLQRAGWQNQAQNQLQGRFYPPPPYSGRNMQFQGTGAQANSPNSPGGIPGQVILGGEMALYRSRLNRPFPTQANRFNPNQGPGGEAMVPGYPSRVGTPLMGWRQSQPQPNQNMGMNVVPAAGQPGNYFQREGVLNPNMQLQRDAPRVPTPTQDQRLPTPTSPFENANTNPPAEAVGVALESGNSADDQGNEQLPHHQNGDAPS